MTTVRMIPDTFGGFDLDEVRRKAEADRKKAEEEARRNAKKKPKVVPAANPAVLDDLVFGPVSDERLNEPDAVRFAEQFGILQSAGEAVYARKKFGDDASWDYQRTRTGAFYVVENGKIFVAFDDIDDPVKNVVVRYAKGGYENGKEILIQSSLIEDVLMRAKDTKRFLELPEYNPIWVSVDGSEYERNPYFIAALGKEMASLNAELIRNKNQTKGKLHLVHAEDVREHAVDGWSVVRPVGLGGGNYGIVNVSANNDLIFGRARGVRASSQNNQGGSQ